MAFGYHKYCVMDLDLYILVVVICYLYYYLKKTRANLPVQWHYVQQWKMAYI